MINIGKANKIKKLFKGIINTNLLVKVAWALAYVDFAGRYILAMCNADLDATKELKSTDIEKYWRNAKQVE